MTDLTGEDNTGGYTPPLLAPVASIDYGLSLRFHVEIDREPRHRCPTCWARRVLYRISFAPTARSGAQCAPCWGLR